MASNIAVACRLLGALRPLAIQHVSGAFLSSATRDIDDAIAGLAFTTDGIVVAGDAIGLDIDRALIVPSRTEVLNLSEFFVENAMLQDAITRTIADHCGQTAAFNFHIVQMFSISRILSSAYRYVREEIVPESERNRVFEQRQIAIDTFQLFGRYLSRNADEIEHELDSAVAERVAALAKLLRRPRAEPAYFARVYRCTEPVLNAAVPQYSEIEDRLRRGKEIIDALRKCRAGRSGWRSFEKLGTACLRLLFVPPFRKVYSQSRTEGGHERRDLALPNNHYTGFWQLIRHEFDSKHVVCELKNNAAPISKVDLNQLRIYLSKPTIGRFGLLLHRGEPSRSAREAQRQAYEQSRILILFVNEMALEKLVKYRAYLGSADAALEDMKTEFELSY
jgi:hypothetical protein